MGLEEEVVEGRGGTAPQRSAMATAPGRKARSLYRNRLPGLGNSADPGDRSPLRIEAYDLSTDNAASRCLLGDRYPVRPIVDVDLISQGEGHPQRK